MNFIHKSVWIASLSVASKPALRQSHAHEGADLLDLCGTCDRSRDLRHSAHYGVLAQDREQPLGGVDAVL
jgi:hypothetical protein